MRAVVHTVVGTPAVEVPGARRVVVGRAADAQAEVGSAASTTVVEVCAYMRVAVDICAQRGCRGGVCVDR
jgi:hypothetical protein